MSCNAALAFGNVCSNNTAITCDPNSSAPAIHTLCDSPSAQCVVKMLPAYVGSAGDLNELVTALNESFDNCTASKFAEAFLCSWTFCANEGGFCSFSGTKNVRYGSDMFTTYFYGTFTNGTPCNNDVFDDPIFGVGKSCAYGGPIPTR